MVWSDDGRVECDHCHRVYRGRLWRKVEFKETGVVWCNRINGVNRCFCAFCLLTQDRGCDLLPPSWQRSISFFLFFHYPLCFLFCRTLVMAFGQHARFRNGQQIF